MINEFLAWEKKAKPEIDHVLSLLTETLPDEPMGLIGTLGAIEVWNGRIGVLLAQADGFLDRYKLVAMPLRENGMSETDRRLKLDSEVSPIRVVRDTLEHICDCIKQRIILGESILSFHKAQYAERKPNIPERIY